MFGIFFLLLYIYVFTLKKTPKHVLKLIWFIIWLNIILSYHKIIILSSIFFYFKRENYFKIKNIITHT
jgi:hypothetical protein